MLLYVLISTLIYLLSDAYTNKYAQLENVPHGNISQNETSIDISHNLLSSFGVEEFSSYVALQTLDVCCNSLVSIDKSAFAGTQLVTLTLFENQLTDIAFAATIADTLTVLRVYDNDIVTFDTTILQQLHLLRTFAIGYNPLQNWPDFSMVGANSSEKLFLKINGIDLPAAESTSYCIFDTINWSFLTNVTVPLIRCDLCNSTSALRVLNLNNRQFDNSIDLSNLTHLANVPSFISLSLTGNRFTQFPELPMNLRQKLRYLILTFCQMEIISVDSLQGYSLSLLDLSCNKFSIVHDGLLTITDRLLMLRQDAGFQQWDPLFWNKLLCNETYFGLRRIDVSQNAMTLSQFPVLNMQACTRSNQLKINIRKVLYIFNLSTMYCY